MWYHPVPLMLTIPARIWLKMGMLFVVLGLILVEASLGVEETFVLDDSFDALFLSEATSERDARTLNVETQYTRWPNRNKIPYTFDKSYSPTETALIKTAMNQIESDLNYWVKFAEVPSTSTEFKIKITPSKPDGIAPERYCYTFPGMLTMASKLTAMGIHEQRLVLARSSTGCLDGAIRSIMKYLAIVLGARNEHQRGDRAGWIEMHSEHLSPLGIVAYKPYTPVEANWKLFPYDYCSVTHNQPKDFATPGTTAFTVLKAPFYIPKLDRLSESDCRSLVLLYSGDPSACTPLNCSQLPAPGSATVSPATFIPQINPQISLITSAPRPIVSLPQIRPGSSAFRPPVQLPQIRPAFPSLVTAGTARPGLITRAPQKPLANIAPHGITTVCRNIITPAPSTSTTTTATTTTEAATAGSTTGAPWTLPTSCPVVTCPVCECKSRCRARPPTTTAFADDEPELTEVTAPPAIKRRGTTTVSTTAATPATTAPPATTSVVAVTTSRTDQSLDALENSCPAKLCSGIVDHAALYLDGETSLLLYGECAQKVDSSFKLVGRSMPLTEAVPSGAVSGPLQAAWTDMDAGQLRMHVIDSLGIQRSCKRNGCDAEPASTNRSTGSLFAVQFGDSEEFRVFSIEDAKVIVDQSAPEEPIRLSDIKGAVPVPPLRYISTAWMMYDADRTRIVAMIARDKVGNQYVAELKVDLTQHPAQFSYKSNPPTTPLFSKIHPCP